MSNRGETTAYFTPPCDARMRRTIVLSSSSGSSPIWRRQFFALLLGVFLINAARAAVDLGWDLSYQTALNDYPMAANEFMRIWPGRYPKRLIHERLATYQGEAIEDSVLVEEPDSHTGDPLATWFIKTRSGAQLCVFHPKFSNRPCTPLERKQVTTLIQEIMAFAPLPMQPSKPSPPTKGDGGDSMQINYFGFLSVYHAGKTLQRPIAMTERVESLHAPGASPEPGTGRLGRAMLKASLSPEQYQKKIGMLDKQVQIQSFHQAIRQGDLEKMNELLDLGVSFESKDNFTEPAIAVAAGAGQQAAVDLLLQRGARIDAKESAALKAAVDADDAPMIDYLVSRGAKVDPPEDSLDVNKKVFETPLGRAVRDGKLQLAELLLQRGADVNAQQATPIVTSAATRMDLPLLELLLKRGADPNRIRKIDKMTALELLVSQSGNLGGWPEDAKKQEAIQRTETKIGDAMRLLVAHGADVNTLRFPCETPYSVAESRHSEQIKGELVRLGADATLHKRCRDHNRQEDLEETREEELLSRNAVAKEAWEAVRYADLEKLEALYRALLQKNERTPAGTSKLAIYYNQLNAFLPSNANAGQKKAALQMAKEWTRAAPASGAAHIFLANIVARASSGGNSILSSPEALRHAEIQANEQAITHLKAFRQEAKNDPEWHRAMVNLLSEPNAVPGALERAVQQAISEHVDYPELYFAAARHLLSHSDNAARRIDDLAMDAAKATREAQGQTMYARVYWYLDQLEYQGKLFERSNARWTDMKRGFDDMVERYPAAWNLNAYAYFACQAGDYKTMDQVLGRLGNQLIFRVWATRKGFGAINYENCLTRAKRPVQAGRMGY